MQIRMHSGGSIAESMERVSVIEPTLAAVTAYISEQWKLWGQVISPEQVKVEKYCYDDRIKWDTYLVTIDGNACAYTDGPICELEPTTKCPDCGCTVYTHGQGKNAPCGNKAKEAHG